MAQNVVLPQWGMEMTDGTITKWLKKEGESVQKGEPLVEIETAKITSELESPASGVVARILFPAGTTVDVGSVLAVIASPGEKVEPPSSPTTTHATPVVASSKPMVVKEPAAQVEPAARRLAREKGIDLATVQGTGPKGRITAEDVEKAASSTTKAPAAAPTGVQALTGMRSVIARRMQRSSQETAAVTLTVEADVTPMVELAQRLREKGIGPLPIVIKAVAASLKEHPQLNAYLRESELRLVHEINIGVAVSVEQGLLVPVLHRVDSKSLQTVADEIRILASKAREGKLTPQDVTGGTFTISSLGPEGVHAFTPIINQPEVAILGLGKITEKPAIYRGEIAKRSLMWLSLTFDHRVLDGVPAARFLQSAAKRLEDTAWLEVG